MIGNNKQVVNMSGLKKDQGGKEWRMKEKKNEDEDEEAGGGNDTKEEWCYLLWECAGFWEVL